MAEDKSFGNTMGAIINNHGIVTQGQIGNNTILYGKPARVLTRESKEWLLTSLPKARPINISAASNIDDAVQFAEQIKQFLASNGYSVSPISIGMYMTSMGVPPTEIQNLVKGDLSLPVHIFVGSPVNLTNPPL